MISSKMELSQDEHTQTSVINKMLSNPPPNNSYPIPHSKGKR